MKKMLVLLLTLCLLAGMVPLGAGATEDTSCEGGTKCTHEAAIGDTHYDTLQEAINAATSGARVTLRKDINPSDPITVSQTLTLDLAGHKIANTSAIWDNDEDKKHWSLIRVSGEGNLTITGDGTLDALKGDCFAIDLYDTTSKCTIENGTFIGNIHAVYVYEGNLTVNGGTFSVKQKHSSEYPDGYVLNCYDDSYNNGNAFITVKGGTFLEFNPQNCRAEGEDTNFCAEGYVGVIEKTEDENTYYTVKPLSEVAVAKTADGKMHTTLAEAITAANDGETVVLLKDTSISQQQTISKSLTLDLGSHTVSYAGSKNGENMFFVTQDNSNVSIRNGSLKIGTAIMSAANSAVVVGANNVTFSMDGVTIEGKDANNGPYIGVTVNGTNTDAVVTLTQCSIKNCGIGVYFPPASSTLKLDDCDISSWAAVAVKGGTVEISDSTLIGTEIGYTADQFKNFSPNSGGANTAGEALYLEGNYDRDANVTVTNSKLDSENNFAIRVQFLSNSTKNITLNGGYYSGAQGVFFEGHADNTNTSYASEAEKAKNVISISGGYFTSDPSEYCADGLTGLPGQYVVDGNTYQYMVGKKLENVTVATGKTEAKRATGVNISDTEVKKIGETKAVGLTPAANDTAADLTAADKADKDAYNKAVEKLGVKDIPEADSENITTVIAPRLEIEITGYDEGTAEATEKSLTLNIEAVYDIKATTATGDTDMVEYDADISDASKVNTVTIEKNAGKLDTTGQEVEISIPLPEGFVTADTKTIYVQHKGYEYEATVTSDEETPPTYTATFTNPHGFSTFVLSTEPKAVATVNGTNYTNFQQAVDDAGTSTIEVKEDGQTATGVTHNLKLTNGTNGQITVAINGKTITIPANGHATFIYTAPTPPRPTEEKHSITISTDGKGQVTGPASAAEDDKVTLTVKPNADKELYDLKVTGEDGKAIAVTKVNDTTYTFTMPDGKVTVAATFGCDGGDNCPSKAFTDLGDKQWYHDSIDYAVENGLLEGTSPTTMEPNATLIRAQLAQILYNIEDKPAVTGEMIFEDVPASEWFYSPILWANQNEIINGTSPTTFEPLEDISRQDLALMLYRYAGKPAVTGDLDGFTDADQVGDWAEEAMAWAVAEGIVQGDTPTTLNPTGTATRAEAAAMLQRFLEDAA